MLTQRGKSECYNIGTKLKQQFHNYIQDNGSNITITSSAIERTAESAYHWLKGINGHSNYQLFKSQYRIQSDMQNELIFRGYSYKLHPKLYNIYMLLKDQSKQQVQVLINSISREVKQLYNVDTSAEDYLDMYYLYDHLQVIVDSGKSLRNQSEFKVHDTLSKFIYYFMYFDNMYIHPTVRKLTTHFMFSQILQQLSIQRNFHMYCLHDANLLCLLIALGFNPKHVPSFASNLLLTQSASGFKAVYSTPIYGKPYIKEYKYNELITILRSGCFNSNRELYEASGNILLKK
jgi:hypothetical protein